MRHWAEMDYKLRSVNSIAHDITLLIWDVSKFLSPRALKETATYGIF